MIEQLRGRCVLKQVGSVILDVGGVGYGVEVCDSTLARLNEDDTSVTMWVHTHVREDSIRLFGFLDYTERQLFTQLLSVSGIGPKVAMSILGSVSVADLVRAVEEDDAAVLEEVPGIGPRQSKKIVLELKSKLAKLAAIGVAAQSKVAPRSAGAVSLFDERRVALATETVRDLRSALENFGYKEKELQPILRKFERDPPARDLPTLIRLALAELAGHGTTVATGRGEDLF